MGGGDRICRKAVRETPVQVRPPPPVPGLSVEGTHPLHPLVPRCLHRAPPAEAPGRRRLSGNRPTRAPFSFLSGLCIYAQRSLLVYGK
jgi:hypothetical protein